MSRLIASSTCGRSARLATAIIATVLASDGVAAAAPVSEVSSRALKMTVGRLVAEVAALHAREPAHSAEYFFSAVTIIIALAAGLIAVAAIFATVVGYRMVRNYVAEEFAKHADGAFVEHGKPVIEAALNSVAERLDTKLGEIDARLADELDQFRRAKPTSP
jgi:hypothetical protein